MYLSTDHFCKFLLSFSILKNAAKILSVDSSQADGPTLQAVHGIRFLSMSWVILGHTWAFTLGVARAYIIYLEYYYTLPHLGIHNGLCTCIYHITTGIVHHISHALLLILNLAVIWPGSARRNCSCPGCLRRDEPAQGGNAAGKSLRVGQ